MFLYLVVAPPSLEQTQLILSFSKYAEPRLPVRCGFDAANTAVRQFLFPWLTAFAQTGKKLIKARPLWLKEQYERCFLH